MRTTTVRRRTLVRVGEVADDIRISSGQAAAAACEFTSPSRDVLDYREEAMNADRILPGSISKRMSVLVRCETAIGHPLIEATAAELRDWLDGHTLVAVTRYSYISHLAGFWRWAMLHERISADPTKKLTRPKLRARLPRPVATADLRILIDQAPNAEIRAMVTLGGYAGLRCMEIAGLEWGDVLEEATPPVVVIAHGKGDKPRIVPICAPIIEALHAHGVRSGRVFTDEKGEPRPPWEVSHMLRKHMHNCGIAGSAHMLRHAFATEVYRRSGDLLMTQNLLGHASPATTATYAAWNQAGAAGVVATLFT